MVPPEPLFEFVCHSSIASLEIPLGKSTEDLVHIAGLCESGAAYDQQVQRIRQKWRRISVPARQLDAVHRRLNDFLFPVDFALVPEVNGYVTRRSTYSNAAPHVGGKYLQKFDVRNFFENITSTEVTLALQQLGFGSEPAALLSTLVTCKGALPLGARTSPRISNLVLRSFDESMVALATSHSLTYTRYADDLSFSGQYAFDVHPDVQEGLESRGLSLNPEKTRAFKTGQPMFVTGLSVSDPEGPRLRKRLKAHLRSELYYIEKFGVDEHAKATGADPISLARQLMGRIQYARTVEPGFVARLAHLYPTAYNMLIPAQPDDRLQRVQRHRRVFLDEVDKAESSSLPFYKPSVPLFP